MSGLEVACSVSARLRGLFAFPRDGDEVLLLAPCRDIHTVGMRDPVDVAFVDGEGRVVHAVRDLGPCRRIRCPEAVATLERYARPRREWFTAGDYAGAEYPQVIEVLESVAKRGVRRFRAAARGKDGKGHG